MPRHWIAAGWSTFFDRARSGSLNWAGAVHPVAVTALSLKWAGWTSTRPLSITGPNDVQYDLTKTCPATIRTLLREDVDVKLRRDMAKHDSNITRTDSGFLPWLAPIKTLINQRETDYWTSTHKAMLKARVANGLFPPEVYGKDDEKLCKICGMVCSQGHRDLHCPARYWQRRQFGLHSGLLESGIRNDGDPLWRRCLVNDPTRCFPPPSASPPRWTIAEDPNNPAFTSDAFGDGSRISLCGNSSNRAAYGVVQLGGDARRPSVRNCLIGPLIYPIQDIPPAELMAFIQYTANAVDDKSLVFYSDCDWVITGAAAGPCGTTAAAHVCADLWEELWRLNDTRKFPISAGKVKAHRKATEVVIGTREHLLREGNCHADAAAKMGLEAHHVDAVAVDDARKLEAVVKSIARFLVAMQLIVAKAGDDADKLDRRTKHARKKAALVRIVHNKGISRTHAPVKMDGGVRCLWCNRRAASRQALARISCTQAPGHELWKSDDLLVCKKCGAFSEHRTQLLKRACTENPDSFAMARRRRVFIDNQHPTRDVDIPPPRLWWRGASQQSVPEDVPRPVDFPGSTANAEYALELARDIGGKIRDYCPFKWPEPDEPRFRLAVDPPCGHDPDWDPDVAEPAQPSDACVGTSRDGRDPLACNIGSGAGMRSRFRIPSARPQANFAANDPVPSEMPLPP